MSGEAGNSRLALLLKAFVTVWRLRERPCAVGIGLANQRRVSGISKPLERAPWVGLVWGLQPAVNVLPSVPRSQ